MRGLLGNFATSQHPPHEVFIEHISRVWPMRASAEALLSNAHVLDFDRNPLGWGASPSRRKGTLHDFVCRQKEAHPDKVLLVRVGEFYEAFGLDAILLVEHCGLNPMGGKARSGCPLQNVQQTINGLTEAGLSVAVFEEADSNPVLASDSPLSGKGYDIEGRRKRSAIKERFLSQVLTPASSTYLYNSVLQVDDIDFVDSEQAGLYIGILVSASAATKSVHYSVAELSVEGKYARVLERLTEESARCIVQDSGWIGRGGPLYTSGLRFPHGAKDRIAPGARLIRLNVGSQATPDDFVNSMISSISADLARADLVPETVRRISHREDEGRRFAPDPLHSTTATQLGLLPSPQCPDLVASLLPSRGAVAAAKTFFRKWLLRPPPHSVADQMHSLVSFFRTTHDGLPEFRRTVLNVNKLVATCTSRQANAALFRNLLQSLEFVESVSQMPSLAPARDPLMCIASHESGISMSAPELRENCSEARESITRIIKPDPMLEIDEDLNGAFEAAVSSARTRGGDNFSKNLLTFKEHLLQLRKRNEEDFASAVRPTSSAAMEVCSDAVKQAWIELKNAVMRDFGGIHEKVSFDQANNVILVRQKSEPSSSVSPCSEWVSPLDRNGRRMDGRWVTQRVRTATAAYLNACDSARQQARLEIAGLCTHLLDHPDGTGDRLLLSSIMSVHMQHIGMSVMLHARESLRKGWTLPKMSHMEGQPAPAMRERTVFDVPRLRPYWMDADEAVENDVSISSQWLVTGANQSGKSTILRSLTAAALLSNAGLCWPAVTTESDVPVPRFDGFFLRTATADSPAEGLSSFAIEADDVRILLRDVTPSSFVAVDEIGRGTSPRDGAAVSGALLEHLDSKRCPVLFSTHFHEQLAKLPLSLSGTGGMKLVDYSLQLGMVESSDAIEAARSRGVPENFLTRAEALSQASRGNARYRQGFVSVLSLLQDITGSEAVLLSARHEIPPVLAGNVACVYALRLSDGSLYIGETESLASRVERHRSNYGRDIQIGIVRVQGGRSAARKAETLAIRECHARGIRLSSAHDATRLFFDPK